MRTRAALVLAPALIALACGNNKSQTAKADTVSDSAATAAASAISRAPTGTAVSMTVTGKQHFDGKLAGRASCTYGGDNRSPTTKVEAFAREAQVSFEIVKPSEGTIPVRSGVVGKHPGPRISNLQFVVNSQTYGDGNGTATITDPVGRTGSLAASHFSRVGVGRRHGSDLSVTVRWECE
ncbi:MAG: hypothetical protein ABI889_08250 [Gemmatimonadota bacterium]